MLSVVLEVDPKQVNPGRDQDQDLTSRISVVVGGKALASQANYLGVIGS